ncbi:hypothetical protein AB0F17_59445 [Nonomuraea sp. NPDC026600]|uniref:hypothetical protein n=1 Tax=Nonomuraea sp. NPDC026600 TaxID=3155363 RepID=UPI0033D62A71
MNSPHECATTVVLNEDESERLAQVPDPAHEPVDALPCELQAGHPGPHMAMAQVSGADTAWWLRWSATDRALIAVDEETGYCEASGPAVDSQNRDECWLCQLPADHFGAHSWQMPNTTTGRIPSEANQQKLIDLANELMERQ